MYLVKHVCGVIFNSNKSCKAQRFHIIRPIMIHNSHSPLLLLFLCNLQPNAHLLFRSTHYPPPSWSIKVSIVVQKFTTSALRTVRVVIQPESSGCPPPHAAELSIIVIHLVHTASIRFDVLLMQPDERLPYLWCTYNLPEVAECS